MKHWYNNGISEVLTEECPIDYIAGRLPVSDITRKKHSENNGIHKLTEDQLIERNNKISNTKQSKTEQEKLEYSNKLSITRKGKGIGKPSWNKGLKSNKPAWNKGKKIGSHWTKQSIIKCNETKKRNKSYIKSETKPEKDYYNKLLETYNADDIETQHVDDKYPFICDFYIKSKQLYIEINAHWTHGGKPFDENDEQCLLQLSRWREKAKISKYFQNAINTWTIRDVKKAKIAKENNLNYLVIY